MSTWGNVQRGTAKPAEEYSHHVNAQPGSSSGKGHSKASKGVKGYGHHVNPQPGGSSGKGELSKEYMDWWDKAWQKPAAPSHGPAPSHGLLPPAAKTDKTSDDSKWVSDSSFGRKTDKTEDDSKWVSASPLENITAAFNAVDEADADLNFPRAEIDAAATLGSGQSSSLQSSSLQSSDGSWIHIKTETC